MKEKPLADLSAKIQNVMGAIVVVSERLKQHAGTNAVIPAPLAAIFDNLLSHAVIDLGKIRKELDRLDAEGRDITRGG